MKIKNAIFYQKCYYHIFNRGNNCENLFYTLENYNYFLRKYDYYLNDFIETYAYCLLPIHFHLLIHVQDDDTTKINFPGFENLEGLCSSNYLSKRFSNFFNA